MGSRSLFVFGGVTCVTVATVIIIHFSQEWEKEVILFPAAYRDKDVL